MTTLLWCWLGLTCLTLLVWLSQIHLLRATSRLMPPLHPDQYSDSKRPLPKVSCLVAAKDEITNIEACLRSLASQDYPDLEVIAVNDRSSDGTGPVIDRLSSENSRIAPVHVSRLRDGWLGKNNAMREGVSRAGGEWLCFTDADCIQVSSRSLAVAMNHALSEGVDFISVLPTHDARSFWERVIQPACSAILMIWFSPMVVNDPRKKAAYANGAFMLMRRSCYDRIGGHAAVKAEFNEDIHLARLAKENGYRLRVVSNRNLYTVRMYESFKQMWNGWSRIFFGCLGTRPKLIATMLALLFGTLLPWSALVVSAAMSLAHSGEPAIWKYFTIISGATCLSQSVVMMWFYSLNRCHPIYGLTYPLGAVIGLGALVNAMRRVGGRTTITWRGTTYGGLGLGQVQPIRDGTIDGILQPPVPLT